MRFHLSLRFVLILFCMVCCILAYLAHLKRQQREVQDIVQQMGGLMAYVDFGKGRMIESSRIALSPDCFYLLLPERYNYVYAPFPDVDDEKLETILKLQGIEGLKISTSTITDKGLSMLKAKHGLKEIHLADIPTVTERAMTESQIL
ncbi:MAG: hypothetical protein ACKN85_15485 [Pirellula sp.]